MPMQNDYVRPDQPSKCTWESKFQKSYNDPHTHQPFHLRDKICNNVLESIGNTPVIKLNHIPQTEGLKCDIFVKCEYFNPGGSVKDRIAARMILDAEKNGILKPGCTIIEPTSGNTGIGLALICAIKGYKCLIVMPEKMSNEKLDTLKALGAEIIRTPNNAGSFDPEGLIAVANRLRNEIPNAVILDQYRNPSNPLAHYDGTAEEILWSFDGQLDMVAATAGTGGTLTGIGRKIKEKCSKCLIIGVDPDQSILARPESINKLKGFFEVEGIGYDFIPTTLDHKSIDEWVKTSDIESFQMARRLICEEGILCGGSSGAAVAGAIKAAKKHNLKVGQKVVVILADNIRNYMTKFLSDNWMEARFMREPKNVQNFSWWNKKIMDINMKKPQKLSTNDLCKNVINILRKESLQQLPVYDIEDNFIGMATLDYVLNRLLLKKCDPQTKIGDILYKTYRTLTVTSNIGLLSRILEVEPFVVIVNNNVNTKKDVCVAILTRLDLINYITN